MRTAARAWALGRSWDAIFDEVYRAYTEAVAIVRADHVEAVTR